jgi:acetylglutamate kinase
MPGTVTRNGKIRRTARSSSGAKLRAAAAPLVIKLGGAAIERAADFPQLFQAIAELHQSEVKRGGGIVLVHGGGAAVDKRLERLGLVSERREGIRITPPEHIDEVVAVLAGVVNKQLVGELLSKGARAVGLCLGDGGIARSVKARGYSFDPGHVGEIDGGDPRLLLTLLGGGFLPVLSSIGLDAHGDPLNINADEAAASLAGLLGARGLVLLTDVPGVLDGAKQLITQLTADEVELRIAGGEITGGMIPKVRGAVRAAQASGAPVIIAPWNDPTVFAGIGANKSVGTRITGGTGVSPVQGERTGGTPVSPRTRARREAASGSQSSRKIRKSRT